MSTNHNYFCAGCSHPSMFPYDGDSIIYDYCGRCSKLRRFYLSPEALEDYLTLMNLVKVVEGLLKKVDGLEALLNINRNEEE